MRSTICPAERGVLFGLFSFGQFDRLLGGGDLLRVDCGLSGAEGIRSACLRGFAQLLGGGDSVRVDCGWKIWLRMGNVAPVWIVASAGICSDEGILSLWGTRPLGAGKRVSCAIGSLLSR